MTAMYVANCTNQVQEFAYRLPESRKVARQPIAIGHQIKLPGDLSTIDIESIIQQNAKYGLVNVLEIDRTKDFAGTCYSLDRPINIDRLRRALEHNFSVLEDRGRVRREEAAVAVNNQIEQELASSGIKNVDLNALEMTIEEIPAKKSPTEATINEGIRVTRRAEDRPSAISALKKSSQVRSRRARTG